MARHHPETPSIASEVYRERGSRQTFAKCERLFSEGEPAGDLHVVESGAVKLVVAQPNGHETILHIVQQGEVVCPGAFLQGRPYCCTAVCETAFSVVRTISHADVCSSLDDIAPATFALLEATASRAALMCKRVAEVTSGSVATRIATLLLRLASDPASPEGPKSRVPLRLTRQEIADLCGTSIESAIRAMRDLEARGIVSSDENGIVVDDRGALLRICRGSKKLH